MLVLTRKEGEKVVINPGEMGQITITIVRIKRDEVRIGIEAPKKTVVHRGEVWEGIKASRANGRKP